MKEEIKYPKLGENIFIQRKKLDLNQEDLGDIIGVTKQTISNWENSNKNMSLDKVKKLASFFNISVNELLGDETNANQEVCDETLEIAKELKELDEEDKEIIMHMIKKLNKNKKDK